MHILINDEPLEIEAPSTLLPILQAQQIPCAGTAVALNNQLIPHSQWGDTALSDNDRITVFSAIAGG